jgi:SAM-dependent methyltransferase
MPGQDPVELNHAYWEVLADLHGQDDYYDSQGLVAGADSLTPEENSAVAQAVGAVRDLDVVHIQCHIGFDAISLARRGARVTGVDFSAAALAKAAHLAAAAGVDARWVQADSMDLPPSLADGFDLAYATQGVLCWIPDVSRWMDSVASVLRPGGKLVLMDTHPVLNMGADELPFHFAFPYTDSGPVSFTEAGSYAAPDATPPMETVQYWRSLGEIINAAIAAGLQIESLTEHVAATAAPLQHLLTRGSDGLLRLEVDGQPLPILFALIASKPVARA